MKVRGRRSLPQLPFHRFAGDLPKLQKGLAVASLSPRLKDASHCKCPTGAKRSIIVLMAGQWPAPYSMRTVLRSTCMIDPLLWLISMFFRVTCVSSALSIIVGVYSLVAACPALVSPILCHPPHSSA